MNVWDHLGELRRRLLICLYALIAGTVFGAWAVNPVLAWLARPVGTLIFTHPTEAFSAQVKIALWISFLLGLPVFLYQAWSFAATGLSKKEKHYLRWAVPSSYVLFMAGAGFASFVLFPRAVGFLLSLRSHFLEPMLTVGSYLDLFLMMGLVGGCLLQLPLALHLLAKAGLLKADFLEHNRRLTYLAIFILASIFNVGPDVFSMLLLAVVGVVLFEISILLIRRESR